MAKPRAAGLQAAGREHPVRETGLRAQADLGAVPTAREPHAARRDQRPLLALQHYSVLPAPRAKRLLSPPPNLQPAESPSLVLSLPLPLALRLKLALPTRPDQRLPPQPTSPLRRIQESARYPPAPAPPLRRRPPPVELAAKPTPLRQPPLRCPRQQPALFSAHQAVPLPAPPRHGGGPGRADQQGRAAGRARRVLSMLGDCRDV